jgi:hypothetical protein
MKMIWLIMKNVQGSINIHENAVVQMTLIGTHAYRNNRSVAI